MPLQKLVNFPKTTNFRFHCPELPLVTELVQDVTIPSMLVNPAEVFSRFNDLQLPGEKIMFTELDVGFVMDENYDAYAEIWSWMNKMAGIDGQNYDETLRSELVCDVEVILLDNRQKQVRKLIFHDAWPTSLGAIPLEVNAEAANVQSILTFQYNLMTLVPDTKNLTNLGDFVYPNH